MAIFKIVRRGYVWIKLKFIKSQNREKLIVTRLCLILLKSINQIHW